jgi:hypothetical protein
MNVLKVNKNLHANILHEISKNYYYFAQIK